MMFLQRILATLLGIVKTPWTFVSGIWQDGGRGQFLVLGMPAVVVSLLALLALGAAYSHDNRSTYTGLADSSRGRTEQLIAEIRSGGYAPVRDIDELEDDDPRKLLSKELEKEALYLDKLIWLEPDDPEHKFQRAMLALREGNAQKTESLMQVIAPFDKAGYDKAHLFLAEIYLKRAARNPTERQINLDRAEKQVDNALIADKNNLQAKKYKATILFQRKRFAPSYALFEELFDEDPIYYREMLYLATVLEKEQDRKLILDRASYRYRQMIDDGIENVEEWVDAWKHYVSCLKQKQDFNAAENALTSELGKVRGDVGKEVFLKQQLSAVYSGRAASKGRDGSANEKRKQLADLDKALQYQSKNAQAQEWLTILAADPEIAEEAQKIYDPRYDPNISWRVLSELGSQALAKNDFENAITYFERARKKNPQDPQVLNNLAYAYLEAKDRSPEQALLLVDQAISNLPPNSTPEIVSSIFDTKGVALMQLGRIEEAAAALEIAFRNRPNSVKIIERLQECYEAVGDDRQAEVYRRRAESLKKKQSASSR